MPKAKDSVSCQGTSWDPEPWGPVRWWLGLPGATACHRPPPSTATLLLTEQTPINMSNANLAPASSTPLPSSHLVPDPSHLLLWKCKGVPAFRELAGSLKLPASHCPELD